MLLLWAIALKSGKGDRLSPNGPSKHWWANFKRRHPNLFGSTEHIITMLCGVSAAGSALPPMIIYPRSFPGGQYKLGGPDDSLYAKSKFGWFDSEPFFKVSGLKKSSSNMKHDTTVSLLTRPMGYRPWTFLSLNP